MNQVTLIGRITRNLNLKTSSTGKPYVYFSIAINDIKDRTDYVSCVAWNKTAENMARFVGKGSLISVVGRISTRKDNNDQYITEIVANNVTFLDNKRKDSSNELYSNQSFETHSSETHNEPVIDSTKASNNQDFDSEISFINNSNVDNSNDDDDEPIIWD